jgi:hypothetical protein
LQGGYYYLYGKSGNLGWKNDRDSGYFCADHDQKYFYTYQGNPTRQGYNFTEVNVGGSQVYTYNFNRPITCGNAFPCRLGWADDGWGLLCPRQRDVMWFK